MGVVQLDAPRNLPLCDATKDADGQIVERAQMIPEDVHDLRTGAETRSTLEQRNLTNDIEAVLASRVRVVAGSAGGG